MILSLFSIFRRLWDAMNILARRMRVFLFLSAILAIAFPCGCGCVSVVSLSEAVDSIGRAEEAWPALGFVLPIGRGERFSALYVLGPDRMAEDYPFDVKAGESYRVFLGVEDHVGSSAYYAVYVKLRSQDYASAQLYRWDA